MTWLISGLTFLLGALLGYGIASKRAAQQAKASIAEQTAALTTQNEALDAEAKQARQDLADTRYKLSQTEKDYNYLKQQSERP